ncbi:Rhodanese-like domain-containing protein [Penicillium sp. IBT 35674x]|nr:Rhodanese-like domain-containing protein [Penicillium sp. IBT 35674x]
MSALPNTFGSLFISPSELHDAVSNGQETHRIIPVAAGRSATLASYETRHIPNSIFFNMDSISDTSSKYPVMMPTASHFSNCMADLGIQSEDIIVVYDTYEIGLYSSPRVAWTFFHFGFKNVHVLNNFPKYVQSGFPISNGQLRGLSSSLSDLTTTFVHGPLCPGEIISFEELRDEILAQPNERPYQILDARPFNQFSGHDKAAYASLRPGHMPDAVSIPLASFLTEEKCLRQVDELRALFTKAGVVESIPAVLTCNSGVTASALGLALRVCGYNMEMRLYDGSWMEWADRVNADGLIVTN